MALNPHSPIVTCLFTYMSICVCTTCMPDVCGRQKKVSHFLELELWMIVSYHVGRWEPNPGSLQVSKGSQLLSRLQPLYLYPLNAGIIGVHPFIWHLGF